MLKRLSYLFVFIFLFSLVTAADFDPRANITLRDRYSINGGVIANFTTYYGDGSQLTGISGGGGGNASFNQSLTDGLYIAQSEEGNLNVNGSDYWDNLNTVNSTQIENNNGVFNILVSWLEGLFISDSEEASLNVNSSDYWDNLNTPSDIAGSEFWYNTSPIDQAYADANDADTTYTNGSGISLVGTEINHSDTSTQPDSDNSGNTYIQDILLDTFGHITSIVTGTVSISNIFDQSLNTTDNVVFNSVNSTDWTNVSITESQVSDLTHTIDTTIGNCSGDGSCGLITYDSELTPHTGDFEILLNIANITGNDDNACTGTDKVTNVTFNEGVLTIVCSADELGGGSVFDQDLNTTADVTFLTLNITDIIRANDWTNVSITESQITNLIHTTDTNITYFNDTGLDLNATNYFSIQLAYRLPLACNDGEIAEYNTATGSWDCGVDNTAASGMSNWVLVASDTAGTATITDSVTVTFADDDSYLNATRVTNTITYSINELQLNATTDNRIALNPEGFLTSVADDSVIVKYQNISNIPTCSGTTKLTFDGTTLSCGADVDTDIDTQKEAGNQPLYNDSTKIYFNDTFQNATIDNRISLNPQNFLTSVADDSVIIKYQNISNLPTCSGTDKLTFDGTTLSCGTDADADTTYTNGSGISLVGTQFNHSDTSAQTSSDNSARTYIQDIILDGFGHITSIIAATETVTDTDTNASTICAGTTTYLDGEGNCDDISSVYEPAGITESDISDLAHVGNNGITLVEANITDLSHTVDTNRTDAQINTLIDNRVVQAFIEALGFVTGAHTIDTISNETDLVNSVNTTSNIESLGFTQGAHAVDTNASTICANTQLLRGDGVCIEEATLGGGNPFDQDLNTTSDVTFGSIYNTSKINEVLYVQTNNGSDIQAKIDQIGSGTVIIPKGNYNILLPIQLRSGIQLRGQSKRNTQLNCTAIGTAGCMKSLDGVRIFDVVVSDLKMWSNNTPESKGIDFTNISTSQFENIEIVDFGYGIYGNGLNYYNTFIHAKVYQNDYNVYLVNASNENRFMSSWFNNANIMTLFINDSNNNNFFGSSFEGADQTIVIEANLNGFHGTRMEFTGTSNLTLKGNENALFSQHVGGVTIVNDGQRNMLLSPRESEDIYFGNDLRVETFSNDRAGLIIDSITFGVTQASVVLRAFTDFRGSGVYYDTFSNDVNDQTYFLGKAYNSDNFQLGFFQDNYDAVAGGANDPGRNSNAIVSFDKSGNVDLDGNITIRGNYISNGTAVFSLQDLNATGGSGGFTTDQNDELNTTGNPTFNSPILTSTLRFQGQAGTGISLYNLSDTGFFQIRTGGTGANTLFMLDKAGGTIMAYLSEILFDKDVSLNQNDLLDVNGIWMRGTPAGARANIHWQNESEVTFARMSAHTSDDVNSPQTHWQIYTSNSTDDMISRFDIDAMTDNPRAEFHDTGLVVSILNNNAPGLRINMSDSGGVPLLININTSSVTCNTPGGLYTDANNIYYCDGASWIDLTAAGTGGFTTDQNDELNTSGSPKFFTGTFNSTGTPLTLGDGTNTNTQVSFAGGRGTFGYDGSDMFLKGGSGHGILIQSDPDRDVKIQSQGTTVLSFIDFVIGTTSAGVFSNNSFFGVGTTTPDAYIDITVPTVDEVALRIGRTDTLDNNDVTFITPSGNPARLRIKTSGIISTDVHTSASGAFTVGDWKFYEDIMLAGNLGVGTDSPTHKLNVVGTSNFTGTALFESDVTITANLNITGQNNFTQGDSRTWWNGSCLNTEVQGTLVQSIGCI